MTSGQIKITAWHVVRDCRPSDPHRPEIGNPNPSRIRFFVLVAAYKLNRASFAPFCNNKIPNGQILNVHLARRRAYQSPFKETVCGGSGLITVVVLIISTRATVALPVFAASFGRC